jgi:hypothetical protein
MKILLWYLPYAMFTGACDVVLTERGSKRAASDGLVPPNQSETHQRSSVWPPPSLDISHYSAVIDQFCERFSWLVSARAARWRREAREELGLFRAAGAAKRGTVVGLG